MDIDIKDRNIRDAFDEAWARLPDSVQDILAPHIDFVVDDYARWDKERQRPLIAVWVTTPGGHQAIVVFENPPNMHNRYWVGVFAGILGHAFDTAVRGWDTMIKDRRNELVARFYALAWGFVVELCFADNLTRALAEGLPSHESKVFQETLLTAWHDEWKLL